MAVNQETAQSLIAKLQQFRTTLATDDQQALDALLQTFGSAARGAAQSPQLEIAAADVARLNTLLLEIDGPTADDGEITPTITTVTITTTVASHPVITCN